MAEFVEQDQLRDAHAAGHAIGGHAGDQGGVFHAAGRIRAAARIDDGEVGIGIVAVLFFEPGQGDYSGLDMTRALAGVVPLHQHPDIRIAAAPVKDDEIRAGGPGEIVDILSVVVVGDSAVGIGFLAGTKAGGADHPLAGNRDVDIVEAKVGVKLGIGVKLVAVPGAVLIDANFREPLSRHDKFLLDAGPRDGWFGQFGGEGHLQADGCAGRQRFRQQQTQHGFIIRIVIVRLNERSALAPVGSIRSGERIDLDITPALPAALAAAAALAGFAHEGGAVVAESVEVEMKLEVRDRRVGTVAPAQRLAAVQQPLSGIDTNLDLVIGDARAQRR